MRTFPPQILASVVLLSFVATGWAEDWPQWRGPNRDGVWPEDGIVERFGEKQLTPKWSVEIGAGYNGPTVANDRVFVMDRVLDPEQQERIHCFDARSGQKIWSHAYDVKYTISYTAGPRASVTIDDNRAYALGAMGHLHCLDAGTGAVLWKRDLNDEYDIRMPIWGIAASPLIYGDLVIVQIGGDEGACVVAFHKKDGDEKWRALSDAAQYASPILVKQAGQDVALVWTGASVSGLEPTTGKLLWRYPFKPSRMPIGVATPVVEGDRVFFTSFYDGSLMLRLDQDAAAVRQVWRAAGPDERRTQALHSIISTPVFEGDYVYGVDSYGELRCLDAKTGKRLWENLSATPKSRWSTIHFVKNGDRYFLFNERGELIIARLTPRGYVEIDRAKLIEPTEEQLRRRGGVCWSHPAFANRCVFARNDKRLVCVDLSAN